MVYKKAVFLVFFVEILLLLKFCNSHSHSFENPSFKYSKEANDDPITVRSREHSSHGFYSNSHMHYHDMVEVWLYSFVSTLLISAVPFLVLSIIPVDNSSERKHILKVLLAFASGGLLGDAFLHLIPHATSPHHSHEHSHEQPYDNKHISGSPHSHDHEHSKNIVIGLWVLAGIITFLSVEKLVRLVNSNEILLQGHIHGASSTTTKEVPEKEAENRKLDEIKHLEKIGKNEKNMEISGYLNLAADFMHNFTDGLAIGASFLTGNSIGLVTTITILLHEVPHEIGDFAILIKSGCSRRKAMLLQLVTALGALSGNALALLGVGTKSDTAPWVLPFTAGGFIYIATVTVLPELLEGSTKLGQSIKEISALLSGVALMVLIANFE